MIFNMFFVIVFSKNYLYCIFLYGHKLMTVLTFCLFSTINVFSKWFHTSKVLDLLLVVVLVGSCVSVKKKEPKIVCALVMLTLKVENMKNPIEKK